MVAGIALACLAGLGAVQSASAGLKIELVFVDEAPPPQPPVIAGGGSLHQIMQVAAENWERVLKRGGDWKLTIEYGWAALPDRSLIGQERMHAEGGRPSRMSHSCVRFNNAPELGEPFVGVFADPTPRDNSEYLSFTSTAVNLDGGWLNTGRVFADATGDAANRADLLMIAMHEIGHALGLDGDYSGFKAQSGVTRMLKVTAPRPFADEEFLVENGPHVDGFSSVLMKIRPQAGERNLISGVDALFAAQLSSFDRPDLSDPAWHVDEDDQRVPKHRTISQFTCTDATQPDRGLW